MNCPNCNNLLRYESSCDPIDINIDTTGYVTIYTCDNCNNIFNYIYNYFTDTSYLEIYKNSEL